jgi:hypothetical protein
MNILNEAIDALSQTKTKFSLKYKQRTDIDFVTFEKDKLLSDFWEFTKLTEFYIISETIFKQNVVNPRKIHFFIKIDCNCFNYLHDPFWPTPKLRNKNRTFYAQFKFVDNDKLLYQFSSKTGHVVGTLYNSVGTLSTSNKEKFICKIDYTINPIYIDEKKRKYLKRFI